MDNNTFDIDDSFEPSISSSSTSSTSGDHDPKVVLEEAVHQLLEDGWFFGKLLDVNYTKPTILLRCYSDPSPNYLDQQILAKTSTCPAPSEKSSSTRKLVMTPATDQERIQEVLEISNSTRNTTAGKSMRKFMTRQLSEHIFLIQKPTCLEKKDGKGEERLVASHGNYTSSRRIKLMILDQLLEQSISVHRSLLRTPSLPPYNIPIGRLEEINESDDEITMSKLIRQAMPLSSDIFPRQRSSKMIMPKYRPPRNSEVESSSDALRNSGCDRTIRQNSSPKNQRKLLEKSLSHIEFYKVQDLGFKFDKQNSNPPSMVEIFSGFQEKKKYIKQDIDEDKDGLRREPYPSSSWQVKSCASAPPIPVWAAKDSAQDMKAQLKSWARAVASNVR